MIWTSQSGHVHGRHCSPKCTDFSSGALRTVRAAPAMRCRPQTSFAPRSSTKESLFPRGDRRKSRSCLIATTDASIPKLVPGSRAGQPRARKVALEVEMRNHSCSFLEQLPPRVGGTKENKRHSTFTSFKNETSLGHGSSSSVCSLPSLSLPKPENLRAVLRTESMVDAGAATLCDSLQR